MKKKGVSAHVYITNNKIQVLTGSCVKNKLQVVNFYEEPLEEGCILNGIIMNNYSLQNTLTQMWQKNNLPTKDVTLVVNGSSITVKPLKIPQVNPKNVPGLIRAEFKDIEGVQNMLVDYSVVNPKNQDGSCSILAVLSTKEFVTSYISLFKEAKIELDVIDLVQNCLIKMMKRLKSLQNKTYAVFILDKNMLMQCLFSNDNFVMTRRSLTRRTKGLNGKWGRTSTASSSSTSRNRPAQTSPIFSSADSPEIRCRCFRILQAISA